MWLIDEEFIHLPRSHDKSLIQLKIWNPIDELIVSMENWNAAQNR